MTYLDEYTKPVIERVTNKPTHRTAEQFLQSGAAILSERGKEYDTNDGERSMERTVAAFNVITGHDLTEAEGWLFMQLLKDVRQWTASGFHEDSAVDCINYAALKAEALARGG